MDDSENNKQNMIAKLEECNQRIKRVKTKIKNINDLKEIRKETLNFLRFLKNISKKLPNSNQQLKQINEIERKVLRTSNKDLLIKIYLEMENKFEVIINAINK